MNQKIKQPKVKDNYRRQIIQENGKEYILEGNAKIATKKISTTEKTIIEEEVFYNPVQIFNRDMTVLAIETFANQQRDKLQTKFNGVNILDALSASGLRSIRFVKEIDPNLLGIVYANDLSTASLALIQENLEANQINQDQVKTTHKDANLLLIESGMGINSIPKFQVIDLDPYGSVAPFLDSAIHACNSMDGRETLLCITCTDSRVLCGPDQQKCFAQYGTARVKVQCFAENGLRTLLYTIASTAGRIGKVMTPLLSLYGEFYLRVFVSIQKDKSETLKLMNQIGNIYVCPQCNSYWVHPYGQSQKTDSGNIIYKPNKNPPKEKCSVCDSNLRINGPIWLGQMNDEKFVQQMKERLQSHHKIFQSYTKVEGKLQGILDQIYFETSPFSYNFTWISSMMKSSNLSKKEIYAALESLGHLYAQGYLQPDEFKVNCEPQVLFDIVKTFKKQKCIGEAYLKNISHDSVFYRIMTAPIVHNPDFNHAVEIIKKTKQFQPNPEKNWGPKQKAVQKKVHQIEDQIIQEGQDIESDSKKKIKT